MFEIVVLILQKYNWFQAKWDVSISVDNPQLTFHFDFKYNDEKANWVDVAVLGVCYSNEVV